MQKRVLDITTHKVAGQPNSYVVLPCLLFIAAGGMTITTMKEIDVDTLYTAKFPVTVLAKPLLN